MITKENIFNEIEKKNYLEVLKSDLVDQVKNKYGETPLHTLAFYGVNVLHHKSVDQIFDDMGNSPLHFLAISGVKEILSHPSVDQVKDNFGYTPLHDLAYWNHLSKEDLRKRYPWYKKEIKNILIAVKNIENTPKSIQFILEDS